jgi:hypothetical protein
VKATILLQGFLQGMSDNVAWACALAIVLFAVYLLTREAVAYGWQSEVISDAALGLCQWTVLLGTSFMTVTLLVVFLAASAIEAYWSYYYPWSVFMT